MRILIVEDEKKVANFIKKGLQQEGYAADIAQDGEEALESAMAFDYDAMVLDLRRLTEAEAAVVCDRIREIVEGPPEGKLPAEDVPYHDLYRSAERLLRWPD